MWVDHACSKSPLPFGMTKVVYLFLLYSLQSNDIACCKANVFKVGFVNTVFWLLVHPNLFKLQEWKTTTSVLRKTAFLCLKGAENVLYAKPVLLHCHISFL